MGTRTGDAAGVGARFVAASNPECRYTWLTYTSRVKRRKSFAHEVRGQSLKASEDERGDAEVEGESDEVSYGKCHRTSGDLRVEFQWMEERRNTKAEQTCGHKWQADAAADGKRGGQIFPPEENDDDDEGAAAQAE